jgi:hypothetical protein
MYPAVLDLSRYSGSSEDRRIENHKVFNALESSRVYDRFWIIFISSRLTYYPTMVDCSFFQTGLIGAPCVDLSFSFL